MPELLPLLLPLPLPCALAMPTPSGPTASAIASSRENIAMIVLIETSFGDCALTALRRHRQSNGYASRCCRCAVGARAAPNSAWHNDEVLKARIALPLFDANAATSVRKPAWLKVRAPGGPNYMRLKMLMRTANLHSVCEEARCPNIGECWEDATATFMILGDICTRNCGYCAIAHGRPTWEDREEPERIGRTIAHLALEYVVITSVNRDDLADGGAAHWAATINAVRRHAPSCRVEVLVPDFQGVRASLQTVMAAAPDILNHNTETVPRLYKRARHGGRYERTLDLFRQARESAPTMPRKSGIILGLGEER
ncbi:MAG TPA: lipoyl synthase, partial [Methylomirabilota bacterium]|nr:lipoyl synthase [Methylomirabilota bacterium]